MKSYKKHSLTVDPRLGKFSKLISLKTNATSVEDAKIELIFTTQIKC